MSRSSRVLAIIQARMGSRRLPNKSLADVAGRPLISRVVDRMRLVSEIDLCVVATSSERADDPLVEWCRGNSVDCYRGSEEDLLDRFYQTAKTRDVELIARVTADDPFKEPAVYSRLIQMCREEQVDYASNTLRPTYPEGVDAEVFTFSALVKTWREAVRASDREHVTPYIWRNPEIFVVRSLEYQQNLAHLRWTVDYEADLAFAREVYRQLADREDFSMSEILELLDRQPELTRTAADVPRNEGYQKSLANENQLNHQT